MIRKLNFFTIFLFAAILFAGEKNKNTTILISFDGFRWDYPYRGLTPNLDAVSAEGVTALSLKPVFPSKTFPNHIAIITGCHPQKHGIIANSFLDKETGRRYRIGDTAEVRKSYWYKREFFWETAMKNDIICASYFWPGSEINDAQRYPDYREYYEHNRDYKIRIEGVLEWIALPENKRPGFITLYFDATDTYGHAFGTNSTQVDSAIGVLDSMIGLLRDGIMKLGMKDSVNLIIVSDHGMINTPQDMIINMDTVLTDVSFRLTDTGPLSGIKTELDYKVLREKISHINHVSVYKKNEMPKYFYYSENEDIDDILLVADPGYTITSGERRPYSSGGNHGYDNNAIEMHGIFFAAGPDFKINYRTGTLKNIDIYPMLCRLFDIEPADGIDGTLENIEYILRK